MVRDFHMAPQELTDSNFDVRTETFTQVFTLPMARWSCPRKSVLSGDHSNWTISPPLLLFPRSNHNFLPLPDDRAVDRIN